MFTLFFTADIQGSARCWEKLLNAAELFKVDALIVSGSLVGSTLQPVVREGSDTWRTVLEDTPVRVKGSEEISALEKKIHTMGRYPCRTLGRWLDLAERKLKKSGRRLVIMPGDDDPLFVDEIIRDSSAAEWADGNIISLTPTHKLISQRACRSSGLDDARRFTEEELFQHLQDRVHNLDDVYNTIFNIQLPPLDAALTNAPCLNCAGAKGSRTKDPIPPGCAAVRRFIETYQPLLSVHGYTHGQDNKFTHIGRTLCCVPGRGHLEGVLSGFLITLQKSKILDFQPIQG